MEANELRIGNWLTFYNLIDPKNHFQVDGRFLFNLTKFDSLNKYYQPIPLTPEILEKAKENFNHVVKDVIEIKPGVYAYNIWTKEMYYVHQLQNLIFCLTGEELEINL